MGVFSRLNNAQKKLTDAENAMPGAYDNSYDQDIQDALQSMTGQNQAGTGYASTGDSYRGALSRLINNAGAGADAAAQTAQGLSGGYGADWAQSAANQAAASQTGSTAGTLAQARADALTQWQQQLRGTSSQLNALLGQDQLERSEYDGSVSNAADWRNYQYDQTQQARQEKSDLLGNIQSVVQNLASNAILGYQRYLGYDQWKQEFNASQEQQARQNNITDLSNKVAAMQQAAEFEKAGMHDAAQATLDMYGIDTTMFDNYQGLTDADKEWFDYASKIQGLGADGYDKLMGTAADKLGYDKSTFESSDALNQKDIRYKVAAKQAMNAITPVSTGSYSTRSTRSSGTSSKSGSTFTTSQLQTMAKDFKSMKEGDPLYDFYKQTLEDAGWLSYDGVGGSGIATRRQQIAANAAQGQQGRGSDAQTIYNSLRLQGYSEDEIAYAMSTLK